MESYKIEWKHSAVKELKQLPKETIRKIHSAVEELSQNPYAHGSKKLIGLENNFRIRVGNYRIVYAVISKVLTVEIISVGHRKDIYR